MYYWACGAPKTVINTSLSISGEPFPPSLALIFIPITQKENIDIAFLIKLARVLVRKLAWIILGLEYLCFGEEDLS